MASQQRGKVELLRQGYEAFNERDFDTVLGLFDDDVEFVEPDGWRYAGTHRGPEAIAEEHFDRILSDIDDFYLDVDRFVEGEDEVVVLGSFRGTAAETGTDIDVPFAHVVEVSDGRIVRLRNYCDTALVERALDG